ncbi:PDZ domain-containing protein [Dirofilaria immitis]
MHIDPNEESNLLDDIAKNDHMAVGLNLSSSKSEERLLPRRRRIADKVSERLSSTWKSVGRKRASFHQLKENEKGTIGGKPSIIKVRADEVIPVEYIQSAIPDVFSTLELSENLNQMMYQPGNAYNEQMINAAKVVGKDMFSDLDPIKRKAKINEDMEKIRVIIQQTTAERLNVMKNMKGIQGSGSHNFAVLEDRLQALAVLMLHYCAALQNCIDLEESCDNQYENRDIADVAPGSRNANVFPNAKESDCVIDEFIRQNPTSSGFPISNQRNDLKFLGGCRCLFKSFRISRCLATCTYSLVLIESDFG